MFKFTSQWLLVIILFLLFVGIIVFALMHPNEISNSTISINSKISNESIIKANEQYKGYSDYIVTPKKASYTIKEIYTKDEKVFINILDSEIFNKSENDSTYGVALGNTISLLMKDFFPSGTTIIIECSDNIVFTGNIL